MIYFILCFAFISTLSAQEPYFVHVESKTDAHHCVGVKTDPQTHECVVTIGWDRLVFDMDSLNKPHGFAFSPCWIGRIDYASGGMKLYSRDGLNGFRSSHRREVRAERQRYHKLHPEYSYLNRDRDYQGRTLLSFWEKHPESNAFIYTGNITKQNKTASANVRGVTDLIPFSKSKL